MARDFQIFGESIVRLRFSSSIPTSPKGPTWELGLTLESIKVQPNFHHYDVKTDSFGPTIPADTLCYLADATIKFKLIHFDPVPLNYWLQESLAGAGQSGTVSVIGGAMPFAGSPMGGGIALYKPGNHYVGLGIVNQVGNAQWRFPATYLTAPPMIMPLGTEKSVVECHVRALPYVPLGYEEGGGSNNPSSIGAVLWDYNPL